MKLEVVQESFMKALSLVSRSVSTKPNLPILSNIYMEAQKGKLILAATDLEVGLILTIKAEVSEEGKIAVPARIFTDFVSSLNAQKIYLETDNLVLKLKSGVYSSSFNCLSADDFPTFPEKGKKMDFEILGEDFEKALGKILFSASIDMSRQILTGVLFEFEKNGLNLVTTDGFRLSSQNLVLKKGEGKNLVIPARGLLEFSHNTETGKNEEKKEAQVSFYLSENKNQMIVEKEGMQVFLRLLEGQYPDYKKIVPANFSVKLMIDREEFLNAVKVAAIFARDNANIVHLSLSEKEQKTAISAQAREMGEGSSVLLGNIEGGDLEISFNARFLAEALNIFSEDRLKLEFSGELKPVRITAEESKDELGKKFFHVLMPVRTGN